MNVKRRARILVALQVTLSMNKHINMHMELQTCVNNELQIHMHMHRICTCIKEKTEYALEHQYYNEVKYILVKIKEPVKVTVKTKAVFRATVAV